MKIKIVIINLYLVSVSSGGEDETINCHLKSGKIYCVIKLVTYFKKSSKMGRTSDYLNLNYVFGSRSDCAKEELNFLELLRQHSFDSDHGKLRE